MYEQKDEELINKDNQKLPRNSSVIMSRLYRLIQDIETI
jgi:hypothetical protein